MRLVTASNVLKSATPQMLSKIARAVENMKRYPQTRFRTRHLIHGGVYYRTMDVHKGSIVAGCLMKIPTALVISGNVVVYDGQEWTHYTGHNVLAGMAGRRQIFLGEEFSTMTMSHATKASTVEDAEKEFTDEHESLLSTREGYENEVVITGV